MELSKAKILGALALALSAFSAAGCVNGPCRQLQNPELAGQQQPGAVGGSSGATAPAAATGAIQAGTAPGSAPRASQPAGAPAGAKSTEATVFVSKPDGSLQCGMGKAMAPEDMAKQLGRIKVFKSEKRPDGMMHIQVCGHPTGMVNVFQIPAASLKEAQTRGFKKFEPSS